MRFIADLHVHSRYSRATSREASLEGFFRWARVKGISLVGTGDFTHPQWLSEISEALVEEDGLLRFRTPPAGSPPGTGSPGGTDVRFILTAEISSIYKKRGATRKVHSLLLVPSLESAAKIQRKLAAIGNIASDGRPILGLDPKDLLSILLETAPGGVFIPAHIWTPWFSLFGSKSGFDRIEDCFEELTPCITALETGLSSDPPMNRRWSALDRFRLVSNSDAHSPANLGREANLFDAPMSYEGVRTALATGQGFRGTFEFYPEEGKYHYDGHRKCAVCQAPEETRARGTGCPVCGKPLTVGVLNRVLSLADRERAEHPRPAEGFRHFIPLPEILGEIVGSGSGSKAVSALYEKTLSAFGSEYAVLFDAPIEDIARQSGAVLAEAIARMRDGRVNPSAGYDGEFGTIRVFGDGELERLRGQADLIAAPRVRPGQAGAAVRPSRLPAAEPRMPAPGAGASPADALVSDLDADQEAVLREAGALSVVHAGPGAGKTRLLTAWLGRAVRDGAARPEQVLAVTFTNRAAREMRERLSAFLGERARGITVTTFHAFCFSLLARRDPSLVTIYGERDREDLLRLILPREAAGKARSIARMIERHYEAAPGCVPPPGLAEVLRLYETELRQAGAADLSALVPLAVRLLRDSPGALGAPGEELRLVAVDELQDINHAQYELLCLLCGESPARSVLCIGDPDQAIYGFRGSDSSLFLRLRDEARARRFSLTRSYRSTATILDAARSILPRAPDCVAVRPRGSPVRVYHAQDPDAEGSFIAESARRMVGGTDSISVDEARDDGQGYSFADIAILYRTRAVRDALMPSLTAAGIPVTVREHSPLHTEEPFTFFVAALRLFANPMDRAPLVRLLGHLEPGWMRRGEAAGIMADRKPAPETAGRLRAAGCIGARAAAAMSGLLGREGELQQVLASGGILALLDRFGACGLAIDRSDPQAAIGEEILREAARERGEDLAGFLRDLSLFSLEDEGAFRSEKVRLLTFHAAKGLEFPVVFIAGAEEGITPVRQALDAGERLGGLREAGECAEGGGERRAADELAEERRLFYVAMTRAMDHLFITHCRRRAVHGEWKEMQPSRFLAPIPEGCMERVSPRRPRETPSSRQLTLFD